MKRKQRIPPMTPNMIRIHKPARPENLNKEGCVPIKTEKYPLSLDFDNPLTFNNVLITIDSINPQMKLKAGP